MKNIVLLLPLIFISQTYAESLVQFEKNLAKKYGQKNFYEVNQEIESEVVNKLAHDSASFNYAFSSVQEQYNLRIHFSPDKTLKFYTFDIGGGGTMGEYSSYVQAQKAGKTILTPIKTGFILDVKQTQFVNKQPIYLVKSYYKGSSCIGAYAINAFKLTQAGKLQAAKAFQTKSAQLDHIKVDFDCKNHEVGHSTPDYIRSSENMNTVDIILLDKDYKPQGKYLRYAKTNTVYKYLGTVK
ncbi:hypothetical protein EXE30_10950 [Acinetobacter halotolerans]|uniref:DUF4852 domain-containing protein n=1 Tax=Acinetobacter halotolerans TaxID=1752076 RepID=A0A4Q6XAL5_9GAMM|nr:hypothetical protein [Acinetobacter halotolerans]RZF51720.1 hypothetical protein EXE30_10950 [Acinetobacter halotolerans]